MSDVIKHNHSVDIVKGWGIIAVMLGHIFLGSAEENIPRYLIYAFHMPLFFFVSGYLLNTEKLGTLSLSQYIRKYAKRMLGWWFVAWVVYTVSVNLMYSGRVIADYESTLHFIIRNIIYP
ncbi:acyltransferase family protein [Bacteroides difficilis]|uniref:Acyltransferase family protein n=1 Tax=Bacteroides difficilis TaxID=2763021 RepID=A0ABR7CF37_9BACE|nr:acyltransferase family protein [Bacteroides difficilis]MBC5606376.1 acyltransferase family protein [Bacteroides difficilis]